MGVPGERAGRCRNGVRRNDLDVRPDPPLRLEEIRHMTAFQCHKTYEDDHDGRPGDSPQQCAGLMAVLSREALEAHGTN